MPKEKMNGTNSRHSSSSEADMTSTFTQLQSAYKQAIGTSTMHQDNSDIQMTTGQYSAPPPDRSWFTRPVHKTLMSDLRSSVSDHKRPVPVHATMDQLADQFFPVTLRTLNSMSAPGEEDAGIGDKLQTISKTKAATLKTSQTLNSSKHTSTSHHMAPSQIMSLVDLPNQRKYEGSTSPIAISTPYEHDLARLRLERLKIEEERLLEYKKQEELERIRGPTPKWYELKTPQFHYEAHKHNELMQSRDHWQELLDYRKELTDTRPFYA